MKLFTEILNFILPRECTGCENILTDEIAPFCSVCYSSFQMPTADEIKTHFMTNFYDDGFISHFISLYKFEASAPIQKVIHSFKYQQRYKVALYMGLLMGKELFRQQTFPKIDFIVPLPLHPVRLADRGFNQAEYLCRGISPIIKAPVLPRLIKRVVNTVTQTSLNVKQRKKNVAGAFKVKKGIQIKDKVILLVDDVKTTGATINECACELMKFGPSKIIAATLAVVK